MPTPLNIFGVVGPTGIKAVAALTLPTGLTTAAGTTIAGGTVTGTATVPTGSGQTFMGLSESPTSVYGGSATIAGTALPDTVDQPFTAEVRQVDPGTDLTNYAAIALAFAAATAAGSVLYSRDVPRTLAGGFLKGGAWGVPTTNPAAGLSGVNITKSSS